MIQSNAKKPRRRKLRKPRRFHPVDNDTFAFEENENPDWLIGAY